MYKELFNLIHPKVHSESQSLSFPPVLEVRVNLDLVDVRDGLRVGDDLLEVAHLVVGDPDGLEDAALVVLLHHLPALQSATIKLMIATFNSYF